MGRAPSSTRARGWRSCAGRLDKQLILYVILLDALLVPWGISHSRALDRVLLAILYLFLKAIALGAVILVIESSFAKLRLYKIPESRSQASCWPCLRS